jgi:glycosyltransferase involved in cell wall biosynthesis
VRRRLLLVAYYFPPQGGMGSIRALSFARELSGQGWDVTVLAPRSGAFHDDPGLRFDGEVVRTGSLELGGIGKRATDADAGDGGRGSAPGSALRQLAHRAVHRYVYFPDGQVGWLVPALVAGLRLVRTTRFDAVLSTAWPFTAHLVARRLAGVARVPWVADFRDPWAERMPRGTFKARVAPRWERRVVQDAAALTFVSESWARRHSERWDRPVEVVFNGHDLASAPDSSVRRGTVAFLGTYYPGAQDLRAAWGAIAADPALRLQIIGELTPELDDELRSCGIASGVEATGFVPNAEATRRIAAADVLLVGGPSDHRTSFGGQIPAKVFEYLATDRPIVCICDPASDVAALLRGRPGCQLVGVGDVDGAAAALQVARGTHHPRDVSELSRAAQARRLATILDRVVDAAAGAR